LQNENQVNAFKLASHKTKRASLFGTKTANIATTAPTVITNAGQTMINAIGGTATI